MLVRDLSTRLSLSGESLEVSTNYRCAWHLYRRPLALESCV